MRNFLLPLGLVSLLACSAPAAPSVAAGDRAGEAPVATQPGHRVEAALGEVVKVGDFGFGLVPDSDPGTRYAPTEKLARKFRQNGLRVRFSGILEESPRGVRLWGSPLRVTRIEVLSDE